MSFLFAGQISSLVAREKPGKSATGSRVDPAAARSMVDYHNRVRAEVGSPKVVWSATVARYAQERAEALARERRLRHLPAGRNPYGENLALGGASAHATYTVIEACRDWASEKAKMPENRKILDLALFNRGVGHYTQMIWGATTEIGAGTATFEKDGFHWIVVVCCYNPRGNELGGSIY